jgi:hypothetical protein
VPGLFVHISFDAFERLREIAKRERRRPQDQAALIVEQAIAHPPSIGQASSRATEPCADAR